jgi:1-acyl-sn-glycerol-3-phosphate acyltransferase
VRLIARLLLFCLRWRSQGNLDKFPTCVLIAAPHTSNWDLFYTLLIAFDLKTGIYWMGKDAIFRRPFGGIMKWLGGLPIDRSQSNNVVAQSIQWLKKTDNLVLTVPPSGTRSRVTHWKTGFYHIADGAGVPIALGFLDYRRRVGGIGPVIRTTGDIEDDMTVISSFYAGITGKYPLKGSEARVYMPPRDKAA